MNRITWPLIATIAVLLHHACVAPLAIAQLPQTRLSSVFPPGGQQGTTVDVVVGGGTDLDELDQMVFSHPGITAALKTDGNGSPVANTFNVNVAADVPVGLYDVRVRGLFGISNPRIFRVDSLPESGEIEPNNSAAQATPVNFGTVVNARANGGTDVDFYKISVAAGQTLVIRCDAARLDSPMQPWLQLFQSNGRRLAESRRVFSQEANLVYTAQQPEELILRVQDTVFGGGDQFVYRLTFDSRPLVDWISPAFVSATSPTTVTVFGRHLPDGTATNRSLLGNPVFQQHWTIAARPDQNPVGATAVQAFSESFWWSEMDGNLVRVGLSDTLAISEAADAPEQPVSAPFEATGTFGEKSDEDAFRFEAKKGEAWIIELFAQRIGSNADPLLMVERINTSADGKVTYARIATEDDDKQNPGGADLPTLADDPSFRLDVPEDGTYRIRLRDRYANARGDARLSYRLSVRAPKPSYSLVVFESFPSADGKAPVSTGAVSLRKGGSYELTVYTYRRDGHSDTIELQAIDLPPGIIARPTKIGPGQVSAKMVLTATADAAEQIAAIRIVGKSGTGDAVLERAAKVATLVHDPINGLPRTARLAHSIVACVMKDEQPFSIVTEPMMADFSQDQQLLIPVQLVKRGGFDAKVDLSFYGLPGEVDAPPVAIEPGNDKVIARLYFKEGAPVSTNTILIQGTSSVPYRRNPWQVDRAKTSATDAEAKVASQQEMVTTADAGLKSAQQMVVTLTEQAKKLTDELAAYAVAQKTLRDDFSKAIGNQKASIELLAGVQQQLAGVKTESGHTSEQYAKAIESVQNAAAAADEASKALDSITVAAVELAKQVASAKEMEATKLAEKTTAEQEVAKRKQDVEKAQTALAAAQKELQLATATKTAADAALKKAEEASQPKPVNVRVISEPLVISIFPAPAKIAVAVPDAGAVKKGGSLAAKVSVTRKNNFSGPMKISLVLPDGVTGLLSDSLELAADQTEATLTISAAADATAGDLANLVIRATGEFNGRVASTEAPVALKIVD